MGICQAVFFDSWFAGGRAILIVQSRAAATPASHAITFARMRISEPVAWLPGCLQWHLGARRRRCHNLQRSRRKREPHESRRPEIAAGSADTAISNRRSSAPATCPRPSAASRPRLWRVPHGPAHRRRRTASASPQLIPGHQIVGEVVAGDSAESPVGIRVGVSWMGGVDGDCWYCRRQMENLCDQPTFTGYTVDGGYAEYALARADFVFPLPGALDDITSRRCSAPASSVFAACASRASNPAKESAFSASARPPPHHRRSAVLEVRSVCLNPRSVHRKLAESLGRHMGGKRKRKAASPARSRHHLRPQRRCGGAALWQPAQRWRGGDQRHSSGPHARNSITTSCCGASAQSAA